MSAPDVAYVRWDRRPSMTRGFPELAPDLVVEVRASAEGERATRDGPEVLEGESVLPGFVLALPTLFA